MSMVSMTVRQIFDLKLWDKVCKYKGINSYAVNEGLIGYDDIIEFDTEFKKVEESDDKQLCYMICSHDKEGTERETEFIYTTFAKQREDLLSAIIDITNSNGIVGMIRLETELV